MKKVEDKLNEILDIAEKDVVPIEHKPVIPRPKEKEDIDTDSEAIQNIVSASTKDESNKEKYPHLSEKSDQV